MTKIIIDGNEHETDELGPKVLEQLQNVRLVDEMILQKNNELQVAQTAQIGYSRALKRELEKIDE